MMSNKTYRFIFVSLTLREGKRGVSVSYVPSEVNNSNDKSTYQFFCFTLMLPNKRNKLLNIESTEKKLNMCLFKICCSPASLQLSSKYHIDGFITPSLEDAINRSHNVFCYCVIFPCYILYFDIFFTKQALFVNMTEGFKYICHAYS